MEKIKPNKLLGQNFLRDKNVLAKIIQAADLKAGESVLEVGPGLGALTEELAKRAGYVVAVEKDKQLAARLKNKFANSQNVEIIEGDILKFIQNPPRPSLKGGGASPPLGGARGDFFLNPYKVVANIPYYLTSHLIRLLLEADHQPTDIVLLIQKEVAQRICACPPKPEGRRGTKPPRRRQGFGGQAKMSLLAVSVQFYAQPKIISYVSKGAFWPNPKVDSAIIKITPHSFRPFKMTPHSSPLYKRGGRGDFLNPSPPPLKKGGIEKFFRVVHAGFSHPRKQLLNNLSAGLKITKTKTADLLQQADLKPEQRAETLTISDWLKITEVFIP